jgi:hypothetical protein
MAKKSSLEALFEKNRYDFTIVNKSKTWFEQQANLLRGRGITPQKILSQAKSDITMTPIPGNLYMFFYDPKHKETLPYYDRFPMVFPWKKYKGGFIGLNLHYLPYGPRVKLMDRLLQFKNNDKMDETTRLRFSYNLIDGVSKFNLAKPCIKQYLTEHMQSPFIHVNSFDWPTAMMLPVERFVGSNKETVWQESIKKTY